MRALLLLMTAAVPLAAFPVPKAAQAKPMAGTIWKGSNVWSQGQRESLTLTFHEGGKLTYDPGSPGLHYTATWEQSGPIVTWTVNNHATFTATVTSDLFEGTGSNKDKNDAVMKFTRLEAK